MSEAISGVGVKFMRSDMLSSGSTFAAVAEITSVKVGGKKRDMTDVSSFDSESGYREFIAGFRDGGTVDLGMNFTRDGYDVLNDDFENDSLVDYQIVFPGSVGTFEFSGFVVSGPDIDAALDKVSGSCSIKVSGVSGFTS